MPCYVVMLETYLQHRLEEMDEEYDLEDEWFPRDRATAYTARMSFAVLRRMFPGQLVSPMVDIDLPTKSLDA